MREHSRCTSVRSIIFSIVMLFCPLGIWAQNAESTNYERSVLISAARELMESTRYCGLITLDKSGHPQVRTMDPFLPGEDMVVWLGTNVNSRKVGEIRHDSRVTLYYEDPNGGGYVVLLGNAYLIDDPEKIGQYWKKEWDEFYPDKGSTFSLIKVIPKKLEIISYRHGITSSLNTWAVPYVEF
jgi:general stress protein 26